MVLKKTNCEGLNTGNTLRPGRRYASQYYKLCPPGYALLFTHLHKVPPYRPQGQRWVLEDAEYFYPDHTGLVPDRQRRPPPLTYRDQDASGADTTLVHSLNKKARWLLEDHIACEIKDDKDGITIWHRYHNYILASEDFKVTLLTRSLTLRDVARGLEGAVTYFGDSSKTVPRSLLQDRLGHPLARRPPPRPGRKAKERKKEALRGRALRAWCRRHGGRAQHWRGVQRRQAEEGNRRPPGLGQSPPGSSSVGKSDVAEIQYVITTQQPLQSNSYSQSALHDSPHPEHRKRRNHASFRASGKQTYLWSQILLQDISLRCQNGRRPSMSDDRVADDEEIVATVYEELVHRPSPLTFDLMDYVIIPSKVRSRPRGESGRPVPASEPPRKVFGPDAADLTMFPKIRADVRGGEATPAQTGAVSSSVPTLRTKGRLGISVGGPGGTSFVKNGQAGGRENTTRNVGRGSRVPEAQPALPAESGRPFDLEFPPFPQASSKDQLPAAGKERLFITMPSTASSLTLTSRPTANHGGRCSCSILRKEFNFNSLQRTFWSERGPEAGSKLGVVFVKNSPLTVRLAMDLVCRVLAQTQDQLTGSGGREGGAGEAGWWLTCRAHKELSPWDTCHPTASRNDAVLVTLELGQDGEVSDHNVARVNERLQLLIRDNTRAGEPCSLQRILSLVSTALRESSDSSRAAPDLRLPVTSPRQAAAPSDVTTWGPAGGKRRPLRLAPPVSTSITPRLPLPPLPPRSPSPAAESRDVTARGGPRVGGADVERPFSILFPPPEDTPRPGWEAAVPGLPAPFFVNSRLKGRKLTRLPPARQPTLTARLLAEYMASHWTKGSGALTSASLPALPPPTPPAAKRSSRVGVSMPDVEAVSGRTHPVRFGAPTVVPAILSSGTEDPVASLLRLHKPSSESAAISGGINDDTGAETVKRLQLSLTVPNAADSNAARSEDVVPRGERGEKELGKSQPGTQARAPPHDSLASELVPHPTSFPVHTLRRKHTKESPGTANAVHVKALRRSRSPPSLVASANVARQLSPPVATSFSRFPDSAVSGMTSLPTTGTKGRLPSLQTKVPDKKSAEVTSATAASPATHSLILPSAPPGSSFGNLPLTSRLKVKNSTPGPSEVAGNSLPPKDIPGDASNRETPVLTAQRRGQRHSTTPSRVGPVIGTALPTSPGPGVASLHPPPHPPPSLPRPAVTGSQSVAVREQIAAAYGGERPSAGGRRKGPPPSSFSPPVAGRGPSMRNSLPSTFVLLPSRSASLSMPHAPLEVKDQFAAAYGGLPAAAEEPTVPAYCETVPSQACPGGEPVEEWSEPLHVSPVRRSSARGSTVSRRGHSPTPSTVYQPVPSLPSSPSPPPRLSPAPVSLYSLTPTPSPPGPLHAHDKSLTTY